MELSYADKRDSDYLVELGVLEPGQDINDLVVGQSSYFDNWPDALDFLAQFDHLAIQPYLRFIDKQDANVRELLQMFGYNVIADMPSGRPFVTKRH